jgi:hypothetical protein
MDCLNLQAREIIKHRHHISVYRVDIKLHYLSPLLSEHADLIFR